MAQEALTPSELRVLRRAANGASIKQISAALYVEPTTVKFHRGNLFAKLGAANMPHAIALAFAGGLLSGEDIQEV